MKLGRVALCIKSSGAKPPLVTVQHSLFFTFLTFSLSFFSDWLDRPLSQPDMGYGIIIFTRLACAIVTRQANISDGGLQVTSQGSQADVKKMRAPRHIALAQVRWE